MTESKVKVPEDVVDDIQLKGAIVDSASDVVATFLEMHAMDTNTNAIDSPVFAGYERKLAAARQEWERAKSAMLESMLDESTRLALKSWNLDYNTCELTYYL